MRINISSVTHYTPGDGVMTNEGKNALWCSSVYCTCRFGVKHIKKKKSEVKGMCLRSGALQWYKEKTDIFFTLLNLNICSVCV